MIKKSLMAAVILAATTGAFAQSADFGLTGTITPGACTISIPGGIVNLGALTKAAVMAWPTDGTVYTVPAQPSPVAITCPTATRLGLAFVDNNAGAAPVLGNVTDPIQFGIKNGTTPGLGGFITLLSTLTVDGGAPAGFLHSPTGTTAWNGTDLFTPGTVLPGNTYGFKTNAASTVPDTVTNIGANFTFWPFLKKSVVDASTSQITINGNATVSLVYL